MLEYSVLKSTYDATVFFFSFCSSCHDRATHADLSPVWYVFMDSHCAEISLNLSMTVLSGKIKSCQKKHVLELKLISYS